MVSAKYFQKDRSIGENSSPYLDLIRKNEYKKLVSYYPYSNDPTVGNINYTAEVNHRQFRGEVPHIPRPLTDKSIRGSLRLDEAQFIKIFQANNQKNIGRFQIGTPTGIEDLTQPPLTIGSQLGTPITNPYTVTGKTTNTVNGRDYFQAYQPDKVEEPTEYTFVTPEPLRRDNRLYWMITPSYQTPTWPKIHSSGRGAIRRLTKY